ncbi:hypothetical protein [Nocardia bhagyanarayanae]|uniref:Uncharacterized protein n=1 Tax=Nocardia bhagyanarayanae TaxID=1215925 RepID=A0A543FE84_9NOCA|nr:hypothetical protein [Nocardia bhagyanarayanae]TQM32190.1 hypothetical protein FB390_3868 [Nocardia bhagyanarayanae]
MITLAALTAQLDRMAEPSEHVPTIVVDVDADADPAVASALTYFDDDDDRTSVLVLHRGEVLGVLSRTAAYTLPPPPQYLRRDADLAGRAVLPGRPRWEVVALRCPQPGCTQRLGLVLYAPELPRCPVHSDAMVAEIR